MTGSTRGTVGALISPRRVPAAPGRFAALALLIAGVTFLSAARARTAITPTSNLLVRLQEPVTPAEITAIQQTGAAVTHRFRSFPLVAVSLPANRIAALEALPAVQHLSRDMGVHGSLEHANPAIGARGGAWNGDAVHGFSGKTGKGVTVAVIDSGVNAVDDISKTGLGLLGSPRIVGGYDFTASPPKAVTDNNDGAGHGTCVAGIVAGNGFDSSQGGLLGSCYRHFQGIAPESSILNLRILDQNGQGTTSNAIAALDYCIQNQAAYNIRVVNLSLGHPPVESYADDPLCQACESAWKAGILVVCAAGNYGRQVASDPNSGTAYVTVLSPGNDPYVLTVGATNDMETDTTTDDTVCTYSSRGPSFQDYILKPDVVAPGNKIIAMRNPGGLIQSLFGATDSVSPSYYWQGVYVATTNYFTFSGTSMAAPMVSGAAADMFEADPTLRPDDVKCRLMRTANKAWRSDGTVWDIYSRGAGYVNLPAALACTDRVSSYAMSPYMTYDASGAYLNFFPNTGNYYGSDASGAQTLWGDSEIGGAQDVYGSQSVWGQMMPGPKPMPPPSQIVWGENDIYADFSPTAAYGE